MKNFIKLVDNTLLNRKLAKTLDFFQNRKARSLSSHSFSCTIDLAFQNSATSLLNHLCDKYGSDKGEAQEIVQPYTWPSHTYTEIYQLIFQLSRHSIKNVLECGIGTNNPALESTMGVRGRPGASLRVWKDYFPTANIVGIDIDETILIEEERIKTFKVDQCDVDMINSFVEHEQIRDIKFDVIIDDGLHTFVAGKTLFEGLQKVLSDEGIYVIEDVTPEDYSLFVEYFSAQKEFFQVRFLDLYRPKTRIDCNRLIIINKNYTSS